MGNLFDLIAGINQPAPARPGLRLVENTTPQAAEEPLHATTAAPCKPDARTRPAPEAASEPVHNAWTITRGGKPICRMVGAPCTRTEALAEARWRWPDADILES